MTNLLVDHVASGHSFFSGIALIFLALLWACYAKGRWTALGQRITAIVGLLLIAVSSTPIPWWLAILAWIMTFFWIGTEGTSRENGRKALPHFRKAVLLLWLAAVVMEIPYHISPALPQMKTRIVYVVGDSISAGIDSEGKTWPGVLADRHGQVVHNLAVASATVSTALKQADRVTESDALVLVEIGGNDVLGGVPTETFEAGLDALLSQLKSKNRTIVLFELPLPPFHGRYGEIQRKLAARHDVILVPKRVLLGVFTGRDATVDSLHLSKKGHEQMAAAVWKVIGPGFDDK